MGIPKNSINLSSEKDDRLQHFKKESERLRENNLTLKMQIIEAREKIQKILKIIKK